jgi:hypothetical protein
LFDFHYNKGAMNEYGKMFKFNFFNTHVRIYRFFSIERAPALWDLLKKTTLNEDIKVGNKSEKTIKKDCGG